MVKTSYQTQFKNYQEITTSNIIVCPHCFEKTEDAFNLCDGETKVIRCGDCAKEYSVCCSISAYYTTTKLDMGDD
jgi:hypothetical protein